MTKIEWVVVCGSASVAPNPRFDSEEEALARYRKEIAIPSYFGPGHRRQASVIKVTTTIEEIEK